MTLELLLKRKLPDAVCMLGELFINLVHECFTLERLPGNYGAMCAIKPGRYRVTMRHSAHFNKILPHIEDVDGRTEIMMHAGNVVSNSEGCVLVGAQLSKDAILQSAAESDALNAKLQAATNAGIEIWVTVVEAA